MNSSRHDRPGHPDPADPPDLADLTDAQRWALYSRWLDHADPAVRANATICLVHQANCLLDQQIAALERQFVEGGGYSEQLAAARIAERQRSRADGAMSPLPTCPLCAKPMALRTAKQGKHAGIQFWGCSAYPECKGARELA